MKNLPADRRETEVLSSWHMARSSLTRDVHTVPLVVEMNAVQLRRYNIIDMEGLPFIVSGETHQLRPSVLLR